MVLEIRVKVGCECSQDASNTGVSVELEEGLDRCHWNIGEEHFTHEELAAVPYADEEPLTTLSDQEGLPVAGDLESADFLAIRIQGSQITGEKKRES